MRLVFTHHGWEDYLHWQTADRTVVTRVNRLLEDAPRDSITGIGKPEQLRHALVGAWSRRITGEHRLVCLVDVHDLVVLQTCYHC